MAQKTPIQSTGMDIYDAVSLICGKRWQEFKDLTGEYPNHDKTNRDKAPALFDAWQLAKDIVNDIDFNHVRPLF